MNATPWIAGLIVAGVVLSLAMILIFFWKVYERGGPTHLEQAARALREVYDPEWASKVMKHVRASGRTQTGTTSPATTWRSRRPSDPEPEFQARRAAEMLRHGGPYSCSG